MPSPQPRAKDRQNRGTHHHADCVAADDVTDLRFTNVKVSRHVRHQAHNHKFPGADGKTTDRERQQNQPGGNFGRYFGCGREGFQR